MNAQTQVVPAGMMQDSKGRFVPKSTIEDIDLARDETVNDVVMMALALRLSIVEYKAQMLGEVQSFIDLSLEQYGAKQNGKKGNITLMSYDGRYKIQIAQQDTISFDERLQAAKELIDECVHEWSDDSNDNVKALINHAFQVDKEGKINTGRILGLRKIKIKDDKWKRAMDAISDSIQVTATRQYIRIYERNDQGGYDQIVLDFSGA